jgi:hypothetical protein
MRQELHGPEPTACREWLAAFCAHHSFGCSLHSTQEEALAVMCAGEYRGECYSVATYHIPTKTLHMCDPLDASCPEKVKRSIEAWLEANPPPASSLARMVRRYSRALAAYNADCNGVPNLTKP